MHDPVVTPQADAVVGSGFGARAAAFFIDLIYLLLLSMVVAAVVGVVLGLVAVIRGGPYAFDEQLLPWLNFVNGTFVMTLYFVLPEGLYGATPGKRRLKLCVVQADGTPCRLGAALIRGLLRYVDLFLFGLVAYLSMRPPLYQRVGDKAAHTLVVGIYSPVIRERRGGGWLIAALGLFLLLSICSTTLLFGVALR